MLCIRIINLFQVLRRDLMSALHKKRSQDIARLILHQDNAPAYRSSLATSAVEAIGIDILSHPPYSPDLAPCDFYLFPKLKSKLRGEHFENVSNLKSCVNNKNLKRLTEEGFHDVFSTWVERHQKSIKVDGRYFEKE